MAQVSNGASQIIAPNRNAVFTNTFIAPQEFGAILPTANQDGLYLRGISPRRIIGCIQDFFVQYYASFSGNIAVPTGGTAKEISIAITVNGEPIPTGIMITTPAAVEELDSVSTQIFVPIPRGCCQNIGIENLSTQDIELQNANLTVFKGGQI